MLIKQKQVKINATPSAMTVFFVDCAKKGNTSVNQFKSRTHEAQMHLMLLSELFFALRANDPETFKRWVAGGINNLGSW